MSGTASSSSSQAPARIADAPVPTRVRQLLEAVWQAADDVLRTPLQLCMVELERALFQHAEKARNSQIQSDIYAQMRTLREQAPQFPGLFLDALAGQLASFRDTPQPIGNTQATAFKTMTLVEDTDIDRDIVLHEMARREGTRGITALQLLGQRFAVLAAQPAFDIERLPTGPYALCRALREAGERLQLNLESQLALYQVFERQVMDRHTELADRLNILFAREGVLPGLVYRPYLVRPSAPRGNAPAGRDTGNGLGPGSRSAGQGPLTSWQGQAPAASWASSLSQELQLPGGLAGAAAGAASAPAVSGAGTGGGSDAAAPAGNPVLSGLHNLLDAARHGVAGGAAGSASAAPSTLTTGGSTEGSHAVAVPSSAVMDLLGKLQSAAAGNRRSIGDIHGALLSQIKAEHGPTAALSSQDTDTLDLLGMLFTQIQREVRSDGPATGLLTQLQVPLLRAAISDASFFQRDQHPARELLNAVAESGAVWLSDDDSDPVLLQKLNESVATVVNDYQGDETVFTEANERIQTHLRAAARRAEVTERRQVEAARGKERLEAAKQLASRTIEDVCANSNPPKFVQTLLRKAWSDVLTLTLLRQGEQSEEWKQREQSTRRISEITALKSGTPDITFGDEIEQSLQQVGYHRDEAGAIARRLSSPGGEDDITSKTELTAKLKARSRLGEAGDRDEDEERRRKEQPERNPAEETHYRQLRTLPFGTWFEFVVNQQGDSRRQRLSWYSLITDNALFVNQRGQKIAELSLDAMARLMAKGQLRMVTEDRGRLIDRAWQATLRTLRSLAGKAPAAAEENA
ncbi:DUF1631 domain-containing protein [Stenotrophomonas sp. MH1]|uniref:DUF1631 domain-containing protein n=1 Tax=Stenotrophomonas capsici TaxID=3110230 RepID=A0ABU5V5C9_9GAMM|nr:DUF1631 domain-containing protein [Stenotrophomonas sp. MH1]MEA5668560.1 DUF1631 domain-containing protein [Stenotrophomonas sp. MH1]